MQQRSDIDERGSMLDKYMCFRCKSVRSFYCSISDIVLGAKILIANRMSLAPEDLQRRGRSKSPARRNYNDKETIVIQEARPLSRLRYDEVLRHGHSKRQRDSYDSGPLKSALKVLTHRESFIREASPASRSRAKSPAFNIPRHFPSDDSSLSHSDRLREVSRGRYVSDQGRQRRLSYTDFKDGANYAGSDEYASEEEARAEEMRMADETKKENREQHIREQAARAIAKKIRPMEQHEQSKTTQRQSYVVEHDAQGRKSIDDLAYGSNSYEERSNSYFEHMARERSVERVSHTLLTPIASLSASISANYSCSPQTLRDLGSSTIASKENIVTVEPKHNRIASTREFSPHIHSLVGPNRRNSLNIPGRPPSTISLGKASVSPLLEPYQGTYQSISPMPSPLISPAQEYDTSLQSLEVLDLSSSAASITRSRRARFHDISGDAVAIARALRNQKLPDPDPLITILPSLNHNQIMELRVEYKKLVKTGSERKGVNIAKHIKLCLKEEDASFMKACYTIALGQWESEAYWANFWYQREKSRRELLIESLVGRSNAEIRSIKAAFSDKRYSDSLSRCMRTELKEDKFKKAILLVLDEIKMEDDPKYGLDRIQIENDVRSLHKCVRSEKGGESIMIEIIVLRSGRHMREVLALYDSTYRQNFAKEMLKKSGNLVVSNLLSSPLFHNMC